MLGTPENVGIGDDVQQVLFIFILGIKVVDKRREGSAGVAIYRFVLPVGLVPYTLRRHVSERAEGVF